MATRVTTCTRWVPMTDSTIVARECVMCGGPLGRKSKAYCSRKCMAVAYEKRALERRGTCVVCGVLRTRGQKGALGMCRTCYHRHWRHETPEKQKGYSRAYARRHPERVHETYRRHDDLRYFDGRRAEVLRQQAGCCADCGDSVGDRSGRDLDVHHIDGTGKRARRHLIANNDLSNLVGLCRSCHRKRHERGGGNDNAPA